jgi:hypothetical protein
MACYTATVFFFATAAACILLSAQMDTLVIAALFSSPFLGFLLGDEYRRQKTIRQTEPEWVKTNQAPQVTFSSRYGFIRSPLGSENFTVMLLAGPSDKRMVVHASLESAMKDANALIRSNLWRLHWKRRFRELSIVVVFTTGVACICAILYIVFG